MKAETKALIDDLNRIRLEEDRSYADLAAGIGMDPGGLYKILNDQSEPYDRTVHKMRRFLERETAKRKGRPRKGEAAA